MILLSLTGTVRMILIIIAVFVIVRFIGKLMIAKRNMDEQRRFNQNNDQFRKAKEESEKEKGRVKVVDRYRDAEDVDYEEVDD
tara:strand:- start:18744 stop:18992 length:249 start_codon:yes stop_codon:yes gene_type:complete